MSEKDVTIAFRAPKALQDLVKEVVSIDTHMNPSEFCREAVREKIKREAPHLYKRLFSEKEASSE